MINALISDVTRDDFLSRVDTSYLSNESIIELKQTINMLHNITNNNLKISVYPHLNYLIDSGSYEAANTIIELIEDISNTYLSPIQLTSHDITKFEDIEIKIVDDEKESEKKHSKSNDDSKNNYPKKKYYDPITIKNKDNFFYANMVKIEDDCSDDVIRFLKRSDLNINNNKNIVVISLNVNNVRDIIRKHRFGNDFKQTIMQLILMKELKIDITNKNYLVSFFKDSIKDKATLAVDDTFLITYLNDFINEEHDKNINLETQLSLLALRIIENVYANNEISIKENHFPHLNSKKVISETKELVANLIGLEKVKKQLADLEKLVLYKKYFNNNKVDFPLNIVFKGNPGTGKTSIARTYANLLYDMNLVTSNELIEITPNDLTAGYVGQTKDKSKNILASAKGKVLFIDEAYLFKNDYYSTGNNPFMEEAIVELLKYLEDNNNVVIFAGYAKEIDYFIECNPGIKSRILYHINFNDFEINELIEILELNLNKYQLILDDKLDHKKIRDLFKLESSKKNFGNARFVENFVKKLYILHGVACVENEQLANKIISTKIINQAIDEYKIENKTINNFGFSIVREATTIE